MKQRIKTLIALESRVRVFGSATGDSVLATPRVFVDRKRLAAKERVGRVQAPGAILSARIDHEHHESPQTARAEVGLPSGGPAAEGGKRSERGPRRLDWLSRLPSTDPSPFLSRAGAGATVRRGKKPAIWVPALAVDFFTGFLATEISGKPQRPRRAGPVKYTAVCFMAARRSTTGYARANLTIARQALDLGPLQL